MSRSGGRSPSPLSWYTFRLNNQMVYYTDARRVSSATAKDFARSEEQVAVPKLVVPLPAARFVQGLSWLVRDRRAEDQTLRPGLDRMLSRSFEKRSTNTAAADVRTRKEIVQNPEPLERYR